MSQTVVFYTRVFRHSKLALNKSNVTWNISLSTPARSLKGMLLLFEDAAAGPAFAHDSEQRPGTKEGRVH